MLHAPPSSSLPAGHGSSLVFCFIDAYRAAESKVGIYWWWVNFVYERNKKLPTQSAGGRYKGNPHNGVMVL